MPAAGVDQREGQVRADDGGAASFFICEGEGVVAETAREARGRTPYFLLQSEEFGSGRDVISERQRWELEHEMRRTNISEEKNIDGDDILDSVSVGGSSSQQNIMQMSSGVDKNCANLPLILVALESNQDFECSIAAAFQVLSLRTEAIDIFYLRIFLCLPYLAPFSFQLLLTVNHKFAVLLWQRFCSDPSTTI